MEKGCSLFFSTNRWSSQFILRSCQSPMPPYLFIKTWTLPEQVSGNINIFWRFNQNLEGVSNSLNNGNKPEPCTICPLIPCLQNNLPCYSCYTLPGSKWGFWRTLIYNGSTGLSKPMKSMASYASRNESESYIQLPSTWMALGRTLNFTPKIAIKK